MNIGLVCPYDLARPGGVQKQVLDLARLLGASESVTLIGPGAAEIEIPDVQRTDVGRVRTIRANRSVVPLALGCDVARRIRAVAGELDVLHVHEPLIPVVGPAALRAGRPVVATFHAQPPAWVGPVYRLIPSRWFRGAVLTAVSSEAAKAPARLGTVVEIPNGLDVDLYKPLASKVPGSVAFLGRPDPRKGLSVLLAAWPLVSSYQPYAELVVIGANGSDHRAVRFVGRVSDEEKRRLLGEASVFVAPNLGAESFGLVVVEAMASGCAVIASDIPAFRAVTGGAAELVAPGDPGALAEALIGLLAAPEEIELKGREARHRAAEYDWSRVLPRYRACYEKAMR